MALISSCRGRAGPFPEASVLLISVDTLRADRLALYGYDRGSTPVLDALGREAVVFESVYSHSPLTLPAHASLLTGLLPPRHGVRSNAGFRLGDSHPTLAVRLADAGWRTGGAVSSFVLSRRTGIGKGFEFYEDAVEGAAPEAFNAPQRDGAVAVGALADWVDSLDGGRFFAFLHLYEPHSPYAPPSRHATALADPYDGEVAYADELIGRLLRRLQDKGLLDRTIVAVTADHGEGLGDHGEPEHGILLHRSTLWVPWILRLPGERLGGTRVSRLVAQADIPATLLDLVGLPFDGLDGTSIRPILEGRELAGRQVYSETLYPRYTFGWSDLRSVTEDRYRYVRAPRPELYDIVEDPRERNNLAAARPAAIEAFEARFTESAPEGAVPRPEPLSAEVADRLRSLGYLAESTAAVAAADLPDPKDRIGVYPRLKGALTAFRQGRVAEAVPRFRELLADDPRMMSVWDMLVDALVRLGRLEEAIGAASHGLDVEPERRPLNLALARIYVQIGQPARAIPHADKATGDAPGGGPELLARLLMREGDLEAAERFARRSLEKSEQRLFATSCLARWRTRRAATARRSMPSAAPSRSSPRGSSCLCSAPTSGTAWLGSGATSRPRPNTELNSWAIPRGPKHGSASGFCTGPRIAAARPGPSSTSGCWSCRQPRPSTTGCWFACTSS